MKKLFSLILSFVMVLSIFNCVPLIANASTIDTNETSADSSCYEYKILEDGTAEITGYTGDGGVVNIPSTIGVYAVTSIGINAFNNCTSLIEVTIPYGVKSIGYNSFANCKSLTSVNLPDSLINIDYFSFDACTALTNITIPDSVTSIGSDVFRGTAYYNNIDNWENGVLYNGNHLIDANYSIEGDYVIKSGVLTIADSAFFGCNSLTGITIPEGVTNIGFSAFSYCSKLTNISFPNSLITINSSAFESCLNLTDITIPDSITSIGGFAFYNTAYYNNPDNWENNLLYIGNHLIKADRAFFGEREIKDGVVTIADYAFYGCYSITGVTIPEGVKRIGWSTFYDCANLKSITIPESVTSIAPNSISLGEGATIYSYQGSVAEAYAKSNGINFEVIPEVGDVNCDDYVTIADATVIMKAMTYITELDAMQYKVADVDHDGIVSVKDATTIQKYLAGLIKKF